MYSAKLSANLLNFNYRFLDFYQRSQGKHRKVVKMETLIRNPIAANIMDMMLSFSLLLALASASYAPEQVSVYGVLLFIGLCSLAVSSASVALLTAGLHIRVAQFRLFQLFSPLGELRWRHLQLVYSLVLASFNWIGFLLTIAIASTIPTHQAYSAASFLSLVLCLSFLLTALISPYDMSDQEDLELKAHLVQKQQRTQQYAEL